MSVPTSFTDAMMRQWMQDLIGPAFQTGAGVIGQGMGMAGQGLGSLAQRAVTPIGQQMSATAAPSGTNFGPEDPSMPMVGSAPPAVPSPQAAPVAAAQPAPAAPPADVGSFGTAPLRSPDIPTPGAPMTGYYNANEQNANLNDALFENPSLAFLNTLGPNYRRNYMMAGAADRYDQFLPVLHGIVQAMGGTPDMANFASEFIKGLTSGNGAMNIGQLLGDFLNKAGSGDQLTGEALQGMQPERILGLMELADRQRGVNPFLARSRQRMAAERLQQEELSRIQRGGETPEGGDTAEWARLLAQFAGR